MTVTRTYYLEINGVPLATYAWEIPDLSSLLDDPTLVGSNRWIPNTGSRPYPRKIGETIYTFPLDVVGDFDEDGNANADPFEGLIVNMDYLKANLGLAESTGNGTVPAVYHRGDLNPLTADVHFLGFKGSRTEGDRLLRTTFDISVADGDLTQGGS